MFLAILLISAFLGLPVGTRVTVAFTGTPVRSGPSYRNTIRGQQTTGVTGKITKACVTDSNPGTQAQTVEVFCYVDFQTGPDGWLPVERLVVVK